MTDNNQEILKLLSSINSQLDSNQASLKNVDSEALHSLLLQLTNTASISSLLYVWQPSGNSFVSKFKNFFLMKVKNIVVNILAPVVNKQEQYNHLVALLIREYVSRKN